MKLIHCTHQNFGDALNEPLFNSLLPDGFLDEDDEVWLLGIGSIIGLKHPSEKTKKVIVFSSGYAPGYGSIPDLQKYEILCVRGPKTAEWLGLPSKVAILDGAYLLPEALQQLVPNHSPKKKYKHTFVPHENKIPHESLYKKICASAGIHYLSPHASVPSFITQVLESEVIIAEAMHAAIVADALKTPWIPASSTRGINRFKWMDFCNSINVPYNPISLPHLFSNRDCSLSLQARFEKYPVVPHILQSPFVLKNIKDIKNINFERSYRKSLLIASQQEPYLSDAELVARKTDALLGKLNQLIQSVNY